MARSLRIRKPMNDAEFKRHLKDLAHGHHHPEEHDWDRQPGADKKHPAAPKQNAAKGTTRARKRRS